MLTPCMNPDEDWLTLLKSKTSQLLSLTHTQAHPSTFVSSQLFLPVLWISTHRSMAPANLSWSAWWWNPTGTGRPRAQPRDLWFTHVINRTATWRPLSLQEDWGCDLRQVNSWYLRQVNSWCLWLLSRSTAYVCAHGTSLAHLCG
jgi:hypothetical protein